MGLLLVLRHVLEHSVGIRDLERVGAKVLHHSASLDEELLDLHVVKNGAVPPGALAKAALRVPRAAHAHATGEEAGSIGKELCLGEVSRVERVAGVLHLLLAALLEAPLAHNKGVVDGQTVDLVDTARLDRLVMLK